ncbi:MAG TPA: porphobilinogen synthase [Candidatus Borkfalkia avistercoris]|uniref:Delta-aminolevulinic acid dehydratase n=1 Tax=Candidatus Borkfalkia avistercoris TaxID=2838504 RepID=A0A9D2D057_9FIRM|nr:porphobilinogen synthase [Candidatus Borkfalkia avistercoris]
MQRLRRLRKNGMLRGLVAETRADVRKLVYPVFVRFGENVKEEVPSMPGVWRYSVDRLREVADAVMQAGIAGVMLFGIPEKKDEAGSGAYDENGVVPRAIRFLKEYCRGKRKGFLVIADICLCEYTSHGHCGALIGGEVENDASLPLHTEAALAAARAGADMVAPSSMMDGVVEAIRGALDGAGFFSLPIMAYSAKFASAFYGPFRDAADSAPKSGDRKSYQMDVRNAREALREILADEREGADIVMVKPALAFLDVVKSARENTLLPLAVYNVSGEYAMVKAAAKEGWLDEKRTVTEIMTAFFRAGADIVITYHALDFARWQRSEDE